MTKCITVKQPWASLIVEGIKDIENRTWKTNFRGRILIHAGQNKLSPVRVLNEQQKAIVKSRMLWNECCLPETGAIIGSVEIVDCVINHPSIWAEKTDLDSIHNHMFDPFYTYNWVLANPIKLDTPIPCKGKLSFWDFDETLIK